MPYEIEWEDEGLKVNLTGAVTVELAKEYETEMHLDERFDQAKYFIWDGTAATSLELNTIQTKMEAVKDMGTSISKEQLMCAFVTTDRVIRKKLDEYIELMNDFQTTWKFRLFDTVPDARRWVEQE